MIDYIHEVDGSGSQFLYMPGGGTESDQQRDDCGECTTSTRTANRSSSSPSANRPNCVKVAQRNGLKGTDIDAFIPHQANLRIIDATEDRLGLRPEAISAWAPYVLLQKRVNALVIQNGNVYKEGLGSKWSKIAEYWASPKSHPEVVDSFLWFEATQQRHIAGTTHPERYNPDTWTDEYAHLSKPGQREIQAALLYDYRTNVSSYPKWQAWLRQRKPATLVVWGANDPSFIAAGAEAFRRDLPDAEIHLLDAGHFALDEQTDQIARFLSISWPNNLPKAHSARIRPLTFIDPAFGHMIRT